jgi:preprotein translocase subunit SecD
VAVVAVVLFVTAYYRLPGFLASLSLALYGLLLVALFSLLGATLTLPGIAGVILSFGMAVDGNVIIFEKLKEELRAGKTLRAAVTAGWRRGLVTILDSNVTTLIGAAVLLWLGTGPIRGFAVTLSLGVVVSMFTAIVVTRWLVELCADLGLQDRLVRVADLPRRGEVAA